MIWINLFTFTDLVDAKFNTQPSCLVNPRFYTITGAHSLICSVELIVHAVHCEDQLVDPVQEEEEQIMRSIPPGQ